LLHRLPLQAHLKLAVPYRLTYRQIPTVFGLLQWEVKPMVKPPALPWRRSFRFDEQSNIVPLLATDWKLMQTPRLLPLRYEKV